MTRIEALEALRERVELAGDKEAAKLVMETKPSLLLNTLVNLGKAAATISKMDADKYPGR